MKQTPMPRRKKPMAQRKAGMKQGSPLQRRTELARGAKGLERHTPMPRSLKPLPAVNKERQARKTEAAGMSKTAAQKIVRARSGGRCEFRIPGVCLGRATNFAHRKPEGQGGLYVPSNLVHSCGHGNNFPGCHRYQEGNRVEAREKGWLVHFNADHRLQPVHMWARVNDEEWAEGDWLLDDVGGAVPTTNLGVAA